MKKLWVSGIFVPMTAQAKSLLHGAAAVTMVCPTVVLEVWQGVSVKVSLLGAASDGWSLKCPNVILCSDP